MENRRFSCSSHPIRRIVLNGGRSIALLQAVRDGEQLASLHVGTCFDLIASAKPHGLQALLRSLVAPEMIHIIRHAVECGPECPFYLRHVIPGSGLEES